MVKRLMLLLVAVAAVAVALPVAASAWGGEGHTQFHSPRLGVAGVVASNTGGVATFKLLDGSMVSGKLSDMTRIFCIFPAGAKRTAAHDSRARGDNPADQNGSGDSGQGLGDNRPIHSCSAGDVSPGRRLAEALLSITPDNSNWRLVIVYL
jgi:hypothetical protein